MLKVRRIASIPTARPSLSRQTPTRTCAATRESLSTLESAALALSRLEGKPEIQDFDAGQLQPDARALSRGGAKSCGAIRFSTTGDLQPSAQRRQVFLDFFMAEGVGADVIGPNRRLGRAFETGQRLARGRAAAL